MDREEMDDTEQGDDRGYEINALLRQAEAGCPGALARLRALAEREPEVVDAAREAVSVQQTLGMGVTSKVNPDFGRSLAQKRNASRKTPAGASPLDKLLAERVLSRWMDVLHYAELCKANAKSAPKWRRYFERRLDEARKMHARADALRKRVRNGAASAEWHGVDE